MVHRVHQVVQGQVVLQEQMELQVVQGQVVVVEQVGLQV